MSDGKTEAMEAMAAERRAPEAREVEYAIRYLERAIHRLNSFYLGGGDDCLKEARGFAGEGVRSIGGLMSERGI